MRQWGVCVEPNQHGATTQFGVYITDNTLHPPQFMAYRKHLGDHTCVSHRDIQGITRVVVMQTAKQTATVTSESS